MIAECEVMWSGWAKQNPPCSRKTENNQKIFFFAQKLRLSINRYGIEN